MSNYIKVTVNLTDVSKPTPLWCNKDINYYVAQFRTFDTTQLKKIVIDGVEVPINQLYQFSSTGEHEVIYYFKDQNLNLQGLLQWVQIGDDNSEQNAVSGDSTHVECNLTSPLTSMHCFASCVLSLKSVTFTNIDTSICNDMSMAFLNCSGLTSLDVSKFNTSNVTNMESMFYDCEGLTSVIMINDVSLVTNVNSMFNSITTTGTFYYNGDYDYSKIIAVIPSTWTAVDLNGGGQ